MYLVCQEIQLWSCHRGFELLLTFSHPLTRALCREAMFLLLSQCGCSGGRVADFNKSIFDLFLYGGYIQKAYNHMVCFEMFSFKRTTVFALFQESDTFAIKLYHM